VTAAPEPPREGVLLPSFALPRAGGGTVRARAYRGRRALALIFIHGPACLDCRAYLAGALGCYDAYAEQDAEVIVVVPSGEDAATTLRHELALPFPMAVDADGAVCCRFGLRPGADAAVMVTDRYGEPRIWQVAGPGHDFPAREALIAELRYLSFTCSAGCAVPLWGER
jgi:peroxiredoxin